MLLLRFLQHHLFQTRWTPVKTEVDADLTSSGKLHQQFGQSGREQQSLSGVRKPPDDLLKLLGKTHFKQPARRKSSGAFTHAHTQLCRSESDILKPASHLSASSNTTYSTFCNFRFISLTTCIRRPGVPIILQGGGGHNIRTMTCRTQSGRISIISKRCDKILTCQDSHGAPQTDHPYWKRAEIHSCSVQVHREEIVSAKKHPAGPHLSPPRIRAVLRPVNFPNYDVTTRRGIKTSATTIE